MNHNKSKNFHIVFIELSLTGAGEKTIEYAKSVGYKVTLITKNKNLNQYDFLKDISIIDCNTNDHHELIKTLTCLNQINPIDGITTTNDFYVPEAALAASEFNCISMGYKSALSARNKYLTRVILNEKCPELNPAFTLAVDINDAIPFVDKVGFPIITKPQNANDSIFVVKISDHKDLQKYFEEFKKFEYLSSGQKISKEILLEKYIDGQEFSCETFQEYGGKRHLLGIMRKDDFIGIENKGEFVEQSASFPYISECNNFYFSQIEKALDALSICCGVIHTEFRVDNNGFVKIVEVNPRIIGDMMGSHGIPLATGINTAQAIVDIALGIPLKLEKNNKNIGVAVIGLHAFQSGKLKNINLDTLKEMPGVEYINIWKPFNSEVCYPSSNADLIGRVLVSGENAEQAIGRARKVYEKSIVEVEQ
ncbi:ATP-grasp domain-containing protein [Fluviispira vulneris]|uniref:ATP-grasp domain-containing protein n=1 Tax=Fluviispira vulneris TaxID=2763012 RepID=UPI0016460490|nr:ATP-grasp domain-containing protein [Fluviispira vulneris]